MDSVKDTAVNEQSPMPLISVIVPVHNTDRYLDQCLESLRNQTLKDIEILLIDDGSTDRSGQICGRFAAEDPRFKVIRRKQGGPAAARNEGLARARGGYLMFVDSDDWAEPGFCEIPFRAAQKNGADMVIFLFERHKKDRTIRQKAFPVEGAASERDVLTAFWPFMTVAPWNKLVRRELFTDIRYPEGRFSEDRAVASRLIHKAERIFLLNRVLYHYRDDRPGSITNVCSVKHLEDSYFYRFMRIDDLKEWGYEYRQEEERLALDYLIVMGRKGPFSGRSERAVRDAPSVPGEMTSRKQRAMFRLYRLSPALFDLVSVLTGRRIRQHREP